MSTEDVQFPGSEAPVETAPAALSCCSTDKQSTCCDSSAKSDCCGSDATAGGGCGCQ